MKNLWRFLISSLIVFLSVIIVDIAVGKIMNYMMKDINNQTAIGKTYYSIYEVDTPVLIVGSSRASHHYVTQMIEDSLGKETYNVGRDGCFFSYNYCIVNSIFDRYSPELIIWENSYNAFLSQNNDPMESLYPYFGGNNKWITDVVNKEEGNGVRFCLNSRIYRYNSIILRVLLRWLTGNSNNNDPLKGYEPLTPKEWKVPPIDSHVEDIEKIIDISKVEMLEKVIKRAKENGTIVVMVDSPIYEKKNKQREGDVENRINEILINNDMYYIDNRYLKEITSCKEYFNDRTHLNREGAKIYTQIFIEQLKRIESIW